MTFEYKVVPAPTRGRKAKGAKTAADRFANALEATMNELAEDGWEYLRADTLPSEERQGFTGRTTVFQNLLVFRRAIAAATASETAEPHLAAEPEITAAAGNTLRARLDSEIAASRAPKLPSAGAAQEVPETSGTPVFSASRRGMAAE